MADDKKSDISVIGTKILEYLASPEASRVATASPEFEDKPVVDKNEAELRRLEAESHARVCAVFADKKEKHKQAAEETTRQLQEVMKGIPPALKKGDKISRREVAESIARCLRGNLSNHPVSEEELQKAFEWMGCMEEKKKALRMQKRYWIPACLLVLLAVAYIAASVISNTGTIPGVWMLMLIFSTVLLVVGNEKRQKRVRDLFRQRLAERK